MEEKCNVILKGTRALLMNSCQFMLEEQETKRARENMSKKQEAERLLYKDKEGNVVVPSLNILACIKDSAVNFKVPGRGKKTFKSFVYAGLRIEPDNIPVISSNGWEVDLKSVVIGSARIIKARPKFIEWKLEFQIEILDPIITPSVLKDILSDAGKYNGLLDFRPLFGLFSVETFEKIKK